MSLDTLETIIPDNVEGADGHNESLDVSAEKIREKLIEIESSWEEIKEDDANFFSRAKAIAESRTTEDENDSYKKRNLVEVVDRREMWSQEQSSDSTMSRISRASMDDNANLFTAEIVNASDEATLTGLVAELETRVSGIGDDLYWNRGEVGKLRQQIVDQSYDSFGYDGQDTTDRLEGLVRESKRQDEESTEKIRGAVSILKNELKVLMQEKLNDLQKKGQEKVESLI